MKKYIQLAFIIVLIKTSSIAQIPVPQILAPDSTNIIKGNNNAESSIVLDISFTELNKREAHKSMTSLQRKSLVRPATGLIIFDTDLNVSFKFDGDEWYQLYVQGRDNRNTKAIENSNGINVRLSPLDGVPFDNFGNSVSISGEYAIIGSSEDKIKGKEQQGSAYIFHRTNGVWKEEFKLIAFDGEAMDNFGCSVCICGDYVIIGASGDEINGKNGQGSAYIFQRIGDIWHQKSKLISPFGRNNDFFGIRVALSANHAIVGSPLDDSGGVTNQGAAYIFKKVNEKWVFESVLYADDALRKDYVGYGFKFGCSVSLLGDFAVVGSYEDDINTNIHQGSAYIFKRIGTNWVQQTKLVANDGVKGDYFGWQVSIYDDLIAISSRNSSSKKQKDIGAVYIFQNVHGTWVQRQKLTAFDSVEGGSFGSDLALYKNHLIVSSLTRAKSANESEQGIIYVYENLNKEWTFVNQIIEPNTGDSDFPVGVTVGIFENIFLIGSLVNESVSFGQIPFLNKKTEGKK